MATRQQNAMFSAVTAASRSEEPCDVSLVAGGPLFRLFRRSRLAGEDLELVHRRLVVLLTVTWLPLLLLSSLNALNGSADGRSFARDIQVHVRLLIALPVLVAAELLVHSLVPRVVRAFFVRGIIQPSDRSRFLHAFRSVIKLRNSISVEIGLLLAVYVGGVWLWHPWVEFATTSWCTRPGGRWNLTPAGFWYVLVSIPVYQFLVLRWYLRLFVWFRFLWAVSRLHLNLVPTHPDRSGGIGFVSMSAYAFVPILFAQCAVFAGFVASRVLYKGQSLLAFKAHAGGIVVLSVLVLLGPLLMFTPRLARVKRDGIFSYGLLAQRYVQGFDKKWIHRNPASGEELLGTSDIQSLADLANSFTVVREMRTVPFGPMGVVYVAAAVALPLLPLLLTTFSPEELIMRIVKIMF
jgi:hypothetical protein